MHRSLNAHVGKLIGHIYAFLVLPTCDQILKQTIA